MKPYLFLIFFYGSLWAQIKHTQSFVYDDQTISYTTYYPDDKVYGTGAFYVFINQDESVVKCLKKPNKRPYFITIPKDVPKEKQEEFFLEFIHAITSRSKMVDSDFYIIADRDYTRRYKEILHDTHRYKGGYMNEITGIYINPDKAKICNMLE